MVKLRITEHTERPEFIQSLEHKLGIQFRIFQELKFDSEDRHKPQGDIFIFKSDSVVVNADDEISFDEKSDSLVTIIETKNLKEQVLEKHSDQLINYMKMTKCRLGFITNYKDLKSLELSDDFSIQNSDLYYSDNMDDLARYVSKKVELLTKITVGYRANEIIAFLERAVDDLIKYTALIDEEEWVKFVRLSDELERESKEKKMTPEERQEREKFIQRTAAYISIAQILFYIVFRNYLIRKRQIQEIDGEDVSSFPKLRHLSISNGVPSQIQDILNDIPKYNLDFRAIFGKNRDIFSHLADDASSVLLKIIKKMEGISAKFVIENDLIGQIFQRLMPFETRKNYAAFYTLNKAAELLCELAINKKEAIIYDPACGSGTLLVKAYHRKKELGLKQHKKLLEQIKGSDISDIAAMMSTINLAIQDPSKWTDEVQIYPHDTFELISGLTRYFDKQQSTADGNKRISPIFAPDQDYRVDVLTGNPPFTRGSRITPKMRNILKSLEMVQKYKINCDFKRINLHAFFLLIAPQLVKKKDGIIAFILPIGAINSEIMIQIWNALFAEGFGIQYMIEASDIDESFSDSQDQEIIVIMQRLYAGETRIVKLYGRLEEKDISILTKKILSIQTRYEKTDDFLGQSIPFVELKSKACMEWRIHPSQILLLIYSKLIPLNKLKLLSIKLQKNKEDLTENELIAFPLDLSDCIQVLPENAARPADYWFIPNKYWEIESVEENSITIKATSLNRIVSSDPKSKKILFLPKSAFVPSMSRTMKKYALCPPIIPVDLISDYYLDDENYPNQDIKNYKKWGESAHKLHYFSESHSHFTAVKNDLGIITKIDFTNTKTLALRFLNPVMGTSVFRMGFSGINEIFSDLLFSYITCSLFLLDALEKSRTRRAEFVRINLIDVYLIYRFPNLNDIIKRQKVVEKILSASKQWNNIPLKQRDRTPDLILNLRRDKNHPLRRLDEAWFEALDIPISLIDIMYQEIEERLRDITAKKTRAITSEEEEDDD